MLAWIHAASMGLGKEETKYAHSPPGFVPLSFLREPLSPLKMDAERHPGNSLPETLIFAYVLSSILSFQIKWFLSFLSQVQMFSGLREKKCSWLEAEAH